MIAKYSKYIIGLLFITIFAFINVYYPLMLKAIAITSTFIFLIAIVQAKRISLYTSGQLDLWTALKGNALTIVIALFTPGRASEFIKPLYYSHKNALTYTQGTAVVVVERFYDVITFFLLVPMIVGLFGADDKHQISDKLFIFGLIALVLVLIFIRCQSFTLKILEKIPFFKIRNILKQFYLDSYELIIKSFTFKQVSLTLLVWLSSWFSYWLFLSLYGGPPINCIDSLFIFIVATLGVVIAVTPGGIGSYETAIVLTLKTYGFSTEQGLAIAIGLRLTHFIPFLLISCYVLLVDRFNFFLKIRQSK